MMNISRLIVSASAAFGLSHVAFAEPRVAYRPNIILILTDDQGYGDLSIHGHPFLKTPNIDRLAREGVQFEDFHVSPTCSPTRSAILTGRHEFMNGVTHTILERERLRLDAKTLPSALKRAGYTTGIFGKWHLGDEPEYRPGKRGFDEWFIHGAGGIGQTYKCSCGDAPGNTYFDPVVLHNGVFKKSSGYCTDVFFGQAGKWIAHQRKPFFAMITPNAPHAPLQVRPEDEARYIGLTANPNAAKFMGMVANIDENVGRLIGLLRERGLEKKTLVIFMNDNGSDGAGLTGYNAGMRGTKGTAFLGGTRASSFWRWPGTLKPSVNRALTAHIDLFPTLAELAGVTLSETESAQIEGKSLIPLLNNPRADWPQRTLFTHFGRWEKGANPNTAKYRQASVRRDQWHLVSTSGTTAPKWMLFEVHKDPGEQSDVVGSHPSVVSELSRAFEEWWTQVQPNLVNEHAPLAKSNPFKVEYWRQLERRGIPPVR